MSKVIETKPALKEDVLALAKSIEKGLTMDKSGIATEASSLYEENLPEELDMKIVKSVTDYNTKFIAAGTFAFGKMAVDALAKDKKLSETSASIKMGVRDTLDIKVLREKDFVNHLANDGSKTTKFGHTVIGYQVKAGKTNSGQLKVARTMISELAMAKLK